MHSFYPIFKNICDNVVEARKLASSKGKEITSWWRKALTVLWNITSKIAQVVVSWTPASQLLNVTLSLLI
jgi:hypothetical protein